MPQPDAMPPQTLLRRQRNVHLPDFEVHAERPGLARALPRVLRAVKATTGYGYGKICRAVRSVSPGGLATLRFEGGAVFAFDALDSYWNYHFKDGFAYEPEIGAALRAFAPLDFAFLDCGANLGYWSALASSDWFGGRETVAVEASSDTFAGLERNMRLNDGRFTALHRALFDRDDVALDFSGQSNHAGRKLVDDGAGSERVVSVTLDSLIAGLRRPDVGGVVIKLDVEGAERQALGGFRRANDVDWAFLYEDHGSDPAHQSTAALREILQPTIYHATPQGAVRRIREAAEITRLKTSRIAGYNFFACREGGEFDRILAGLCAG